MWISLISFCFIEMVMYLPKFQKKELLEQFLDQTPLKDE